MAYEVTATRRRPKTFDEMAGQEFVVATLKSSIETGRIAHAYLFSGPRGCGKTSAARILARSLNCEKGPTAVPCGTCPSCVEIARGSCMDVIEIDGASNTSVNDVRQIKDEVLFPPNGSRFKVYIIDEVHMLSNNAFNALLKTIEEPPPYIVFIFATTELHKVPATIKSRCQQFAFRLFPIETIKAQLLEACRESGIEAEDEALFWIAKEATGSMRDAYTLFDQVVSFSEGVLSAELIRDKLGLVGLDALNALAEACADGRTADALNALDGILERGVSVERFTVDLAEYYRSLLLLKSGIERESLLGYGPERFSPRALEAFTAVQIERALSLLLDLYRDIRFSVSPRFELETAVSRLCWLSRWVSPAELRAAVDGVRGRLLIPEPHARWGPADAGPADAGPAPGSAARDPATSAAVVSTAVSSGGAGAAAAPAPAAAAPPTDFGAINLEAPGAFTATFKRFLAEREGRVAADPPAEAQAVMQPAAVPAAAPAATPPAVMQPVAISAAPVAIEDVDEDEDQVSGSDEIRPESGMGQAAVAQVATAAELAEAKLACIAALKKERGMLASGLEKSGAWEASGDAVRIPAADKLAAGMLLKDSNAISAALRTALGRPVRLEITERPAGEGPAAGVQARTELPPQVETVRRMFRGSIVRNAR